MVTNLTGRFIDSETLPNDALTNLIKRIHINILGHGQQTLPSAFTLKECSVHSFLILYAINGTADICHNGEKTQLDAGSFYMFIPSEVYGVSVIGTDTLFHNSSFTFVYVYFDMYPIAIRSIFKQHAFLAGKQIYQKLWYRKIGSYISELCMPAYKKLPGHNFLVSHVTEGIVAYVLHEHVAPGLSVNYASSMKEGNLVDMTYEYTVSHLSDPIDIAEIARSLGTSRSTLNRTFNHVLNTTPSQAMTSFKILLSLDMLRAGTPIKKIAKNLGYNSTSHYSKTFKAVMGKVPSAYVNEQALTGSSPRA